MAVGDYWCQVVNTTTLPHTVYGTSNVFRIKYPYQYDPLSEKCTGRHRNLTNTCADVPVNTENGAAEIPLESFESSIKVVRFPQPSSTSSAGITNTALTSTTQTKPQIVTVEPSLTITKTVPMESSVVGNKCEYKCMPHACMHACTLVMAKAGDISIQLHICMIYIQYHHL